MDPKHRRKETTMNKRTLTALLAASAIAIGTAAPVFASDTQDIAALGQAKVTLQQAITAAQQKHAGARVIDADFDTHKNGSADYEIKLVTTNNQVFKVIVDPQTGNVTADRPHGQRNKPVPAPSVSLEQALETALQQHQGGKVLQAELEGRKDGTADYEFDVVTANSQIYKVRIDGQNGKVVANYLDD